MAVHVRIELRADDQVECGVGIVVKISSFDLMITDSFLNTD